MKMADDDDDNNNNNNNNKVLVFVIFLCRFWQKPGYFYNYAMAVDTANKEKEIKIKYRLEVRGFKMYDNNTEIDRWTLKETAGGGGGGGGWLGGR
jgi:hypothetical protein